MFYKKDDKGIWWKSKNVHLPTGEVLTEDNKLELDGWKWYNEPPQEYLEWEESRLYGDDQRI